MLLTFQYPVLDSRAFLDYPAWRVNLPIWPIPQVNHDYVRSFGVTRKRTRGGISGYSGEASYCSFERALRFPCSLNWVEPLLDIHRSKCAFKRFSFDGLAVGRFELGICGHEPSELGEPLQQHGRFRSFLEGIFGVDQAPLVETEPVEHELTDAINTILLGKVFVATGQRTGGLREWGLHSLRSVGEALAELYLISTSIHDQDQGFERPSWWVSSCPPVCILESESAALYSGLRAAAVPIVSKGPDWPSLFAFQVGLPNSDMTCWVICCFGVSYDKVRRLRMLLLRIHAERECLRVLLRYLVTEHVAPAPYGPANASLQQYLQDASVLVEKPEAYGYPQGSIGQYAVDASDAILPGDREALVAILRRLRVRPNVMRNVVTVERQYV